MPETEQNFRGVSLKRELVAEIERFIEEYPRYKSIADFVHEATRVRMENIRNTAPPRFEKINADNDGVKIHDRALREVVQLYFKRDGIRCGIDGIDSCDHVKFALSLPEVQDIVRKHRKEGWKLPDV